MPFAVALVLLLAFVRSAGPCPDPSPAGVEATQASPTSIESTTRRVTAEYLREQFEERDLERACALLAPDVSFVDPTAEVWGGPAAKGVQGRDAFRRLAVSWGLASSHFDVRHSFVSGEYGVFAGLLSWRAEGAAPVEGVPFCTVLRVVERQIVERTDYGDYDDLLGEDAGHPERLGGLVERFFAAYRALDLEVLDELLADDVARCDPIGASMGRPAEASASRGKVHALADFERAREYLRDLEVEPGMSFVSGTHAFAMGTVRYDLVEGDAELSLEHPFVHVVRFVDGKVTEHRRYLDHAGIERQVAAQVGRLGGADDGPR